LFVSAVDRVPSVIESPKVTIAAVCAGAITSTREIRNHERVCVLAGHVTSPTWDPAVDT
jgi:hypothetical protein